MTPICLKGRWRKQMTDSDLDQSTLQKAGDRLRLDSKAVAEAGDALRLRVKEVAEK
eukprot:CAMPEP_0196657162 /NCGR_PEP_ID=MMETSP1086-20130531/22212_1 /TAXON_ID=77921 /ORGANISM="Cyanoptyche  gloeocystis , Strain SAG4.97" /LENGTH=55 /DNA_ID=CAMNT_0041990189 /DNA_START=80 /DNA_END=247 /DNA_ORIENTATION=+